MNKITLENNHQALVFKPKDSTHAILFATGSGGDPERHLPLLQALAQNNCTVIAPYFERMTSPRPSEELLLARRSLLNLAFAKLPNLPTIAIGHSIGATLLLTFAGARMWLSPTQTLPSTIHPLLKKLILIAPPAGYFQAPNSLDDVSLPLQIWSGTADTITRPSQIEIFKAQKFPVNIQLIDQANHFSFMHTLPPTTADVMPNSDEFLEKFTDEICRFATT